MDTTIPNWFYDWSVITKNDARYVVEVRQYNSQSIPSTIPWKPYEPAYAMPWLLPPSGSVHYAHWSFLATHPSGSVYDMSGHRATLVNAKTALETDNFWVSRRAMYPILGGGTSGYELDAASSAPLALPNASFSWEMYVYGLDATTTSSGILLSHATGTQGYSIQFDVPNSLLKFTVGSASIAATASASIAPYLAESGYPGNYHYFAGSFVKGSGLYVYMDGQQTLFVPYAGGVHSASIGFAVRGGESMFVDEFSLWSGVLDNNMAAQRYASTKERLRYLGLTSGSFQAFHQARFTFFASGSQEVELHSFSLRGIQNPAMSMLSPSTTSLFSVPMYHSTTGSV